jgi:hypothetical protein
VRLAGEQLSAVCRLDLYGAWRLLTTFQASDPHHRQGPTPTAVNIPVPDNPGRHDRMPVQLVLWRPKTMQNG